MPSFIDIITELKTILENDTDLNAWAQTNYSMNVSVFKGASWSENRLPNVHILIVDGLDRELEHMVMVREQDHFIGLVCRLKDRDNDTRFDNIISFKERVEDIIHANFTINGQATLASILGGNPNPSYKIGPDMSQHLIQVKINHVVSQLVFGW